MTKTLVICIGNQEGGDDGIGPYIAKRWNSESSDFLIIDGGTTPENYTGLIKQHKPHTLILIDATEMNLPVGEIRIIPKEKLGTMHLGTHRIPLSVFIQYMETEVPTIILIGIQPETMNGPLSDPVKNSGERLMKLLQQRKIETIPLLQ
jgi:hydrogenase 3 maturation protease